MIKYKLLQIIQKALCGLFIMTYGFFPLEISNGGILSFEKLDYCKKRKLRDRSIREYIGGGDTSFSGIWTWDNYRGSVSWGKYQRNRHISVQEQLLLKCLITGLLGKNWFWAGNLCRSPTIDKYSCLSSNLSSSPNFSFLNKNDDYMKKHTSASANSSSNLFTRYFLILHAHSHIIWRYVSAFCQIPRLCEMLSKLIHFDSLVIVLNFITIFVFQFFRKDVLN